MNIETVVTIESKPVKKTQPQPRADLLKTWIATSPGKITANPNLPRQRPTLLMVTEEPGRKNILGGKSA